MALAIPPEDLEDWNGRADVTVNPGFFAVRYKMRDDPRYGAMMRLASEAGIPSLYLLGVLWAVSGMALKQRRPGLLAARPDAISLVELLRFWGAIGDDHRLVSRAVQILVSSRLLVLVDPAHAQTHQRWPIPEARRRQRSNDEAAPAQKPASASTGMPVPPSSDRVRPGTDEWARLLQATARWTRQIRQLARKAPYPADIRDDSDLATALELAYRTQRMDALRKTLAAACSWADKGSGIRAALREAGLLPGR